MNRGEFITVIIFLLGGFVAFYFGDIYERKFSIKTSKIQAAILGHLEIAMRGFIERYKGSGSTGIQEDEYANFIGYFRDSKILTHLNHYENILSYDREGEEITNKISYCCVLLLIPLVLYYYKIFPQLYISLGYILSLFLFTKIIDFYRMSNYINNLYKEYVLDQRSFGGYDQ